MQQLTEGTGSNALVFEFPNEWKVLKYDDSEFYKEKVLKCQGTKAVDFLVIEQNRQLWIEVKNFRNYAADNLLRLDSNESHVLGLTETRTHIMENGWDRTVVVSRKQHFIADEIALKVRDTCAGVFGAAIQGDIELQDFATALQAHQAIHVVLFLQQNVALENPRDFRRMAQRIGDKIIQQLGFINATVEVVNRNTLSVNAQWRVV